MRHFEGKTVVITGSGAGIGQALAIEFSRRGAIVFVTDITLDHTLETCEKIIQEGNTAYPFKVDVTKCEDLKEVMQMVVDEHGQLDLFINNAGLLYIGEYYDMEIDFMQKLIDVNFTAVANGTLQAYQIMKEQGSGHIVNVASQGGLMPVVSMAAYSGTKHGVVGLTTSVRAEARKFGVDLSVVCYGNVQSKMIESSQRNNISVKEVHDVLGFKPMATDKAARITVDGIADNKAYILLPYYAKLLWWITRLSPALITQGLQRATMNKFRQKMANR